MWCFAHDHDDLFKQRFDSAFARGEAERVGKAAAGGLIGYDFGPVDLQVLVTDQFWAQDSPVGPGNLDVWMRLGFKIWGFEAPAAPLVTKM
jgi:hypothetical protein